jgi:Pyridoxal-phosphate dependent enzyme
MVLHKRTGPWSGRFFLQPPLFILHHLSHVHHHRFPPAQPALLQRLELVSREIGNTPSVRLQGIFDHPNVALYAKLEWQQFGQSAKALAAYSIIADAVRTGRLDAHKVLLDATSGNTGIAYAAIGLRVRLVPPGISDASAGITDAGVKGEWCA